MQVLCAADESYNLNLTRHKLDEWTVQVPSDESGSTYTEFIPLTILQQQAPPLSQGVFYSEPLYCRVDNKHPESTQFTEHTQITTIETHQVVCLVSSLVEFFGWTVYI